MKYLRLALISSAAVLCSLPIRAQDEQQQKAPTEIPDFNNLDEYIYVPKSKLKFGFRYTSGIKAHFAGQGTIASPEEVSNADRAAPNVQRVYHDGTVAPDQRTTATDNGDGTSTQQLVNGADGKTNAYSYDSQSQYTGDGFLQYHLYSAVTQDNEFDKTGKGNAGMEVFVAHDMKVLSKHWEWKIFGGFSVNDIQASASRHVTAAVTTQTDTYDTSGQTPSTNGASTTSSVNIVDGNGNLVLDSTGTPETVTVTNTVLISDVPIATGTSTTTDNVSVTDQYKLHGAYATIRVGPQLVYNFNDHLHLELSAGPALIFAGSTYQVDELLLPATGVQLVETITNTTNHLLPGWYADLTMEYDLTERAGFYLGAFDQSAGSYTQTASSSSGTYTTKVDFSNQAGFRSGLSFKF
jgi:hypothetical protein